MSNRQITIAVDAMGGENSPLKCLKGIEIFSSKKPDVNFKEVPQQKRMHGESLQQKGRHVLGLTTRNEKTHGF